MAKLKFFDEILAPAGILSLDYKGKNPFVAVGLAPKLLKGIMRISAKDLFETDVRWDVTSEPKEFFGRWMGKRSEDNWTTTIITIKIQGAQHSKDKTGWVHVEFGGKVETSYNYSNFIQRSFWWFFNKFFYHNQRRKYIEFAKDNIYDMKEKLQEVFDILKE